MDNCLQQAIDMLTKNNWHKFPDETPTESGWYQCTIAFEINENAIRSYVMDLWWDNEYKKFKDNRRLNVYETYEVYGYSSSSNCGKERKHMDRLCDRTSSVVAWQPLASIYKLSKYEEAMIHAKAREV